MDHRTEQYAAALSRMISYETVSDRNNTDPEKFIVFRSLLAELFPSIFEFCSRTEFENGFAMKWPGTDQS